MDHKKLFRDTLESINILGVPGLFVVGIWIPSKGDYNYYDVVKPWNKIKYLNQQYLPQKTLDDVREDYLIYIQIGLPVDIYS